MADEIASKNQMVHVLHRPKKTGWAALISRVPMGAGGGTTNLFSRWTVISRIIRTDVPAFLQAAQQGADLVLGSRYSNGIRVINCLEAADVGAWAPANTSASLPECVLRSDRGLQNVSGAAPSLSLNLERKCAPMATASKSS